MFVKHHRWMIGGAWLLSLILIAATAFAIAGGKIQSIPLYQTSGGKTITLTSATTTNKAVTYIVSGGTEDGSSNAVAWSPDGRQLAFTGPVEEGPSAGKYDFTVEVLCLDSREPKLFKGLPGWVVSVAWSPDGRWLAASSFGGQTLIWNASTGQIQASMAGYDGLAWSPDSQSIVTGNVWGWVDVYDLQGHQLKHMHLFDNVVTENAWSPHGEIISSSPFSNRAIVWSAKTGQAEYGLQTDGDVQAVAWSPNGRYIATASSDQDTSSVEIWSTRDHSAQRYAGSSQDQKNPFAFVEALAWSQDSSRLAGGNDNGLTWVLQMGNPGTIAINGGHEGSQVRSVAWSPRGVASTGDDMTVQVWNPKA